MTVEAKDGSNKGNNNANGSTSTSLDNKKAKKAAMKKEAELLGISYDELKKRHKRKHHREAESLDTPEHKEEIKRLRAYSDDWNKGGKGTTGGGGKNGSAHNKNKNGSNNPSDDQDDDASSNKRRRTRSMDATEENESIIREERKLTPEEWRVEHTITLRGHGVNSTNGNNFPAPYIEFIDAPFSQRIQGGFKSAGFARPTPIQAQAWPLAIEGRDLISIAKTGSGKTCGFLLPVFHHHEQQKHKNQTGRLYQSSKPILLVLAPTRELSVQIMEEAVKFGRPLGIRSVCCYGGAPKYPQIQAIQRGVECIIACPGRLNDLIEMKKVDLSSIQYLVLDEADRMLDMGFEPQIRSIVAKIPTERQTMLFSATWPKEIQKLAHDFLRDPVQINVGEVNTLVANKDIEQQIIMCNEGDKFDKLATILKDLTSEAATEGGGGSAGHVAGGGKVHAKVIVFVAKKISCHDLANKLWDDGFAVDALHGDRPQWERSKVMQAFKQGALRMLIATDVAARGLDVKDVGVVVNYDMPAGVNGVEDYVHRIGRTGRAGAKGKAITFFTQNDKKCATQLVDVLTQAGQFVPPELQSLVRRPRGFGGGGGRFGGGRGGYGRGGRGGGGRGYMNGGGGGGGRGYMNGGGGGGGGRRVGYGGRGGYSRGPY